MNNIFKSIAVGLVAGTSLFTLNSCKKDFLTQLPTTQVTHEQVFETTQGARAAVNGIHAMMYEVSDHDQFGIPSIGIMSDMMCGDMGCERIGSGWFITAYWFRDRNPDNTGSYMWSFFYRIINNANMIIANIDNAKGTQEDKNEIKAQALFYRAYAYFNLANYYQFTYFDNQYVTAAEGGSGTGVVTKSATLDQALGLPLYTEPTQTAKPRATLRETYDLINSDLAQAISLFENTTIDRGSDKSQINLQVAQGLQARVALYQQDWTKAAQFANAARQGYDLMTGRQAFRSGMNSVNNSEWIWGLEINAEANGIYASFLSHMSNDIEGAYAKSQGRLISNVFFNETFSGDTAWMAEDDYRREWGETIEHPTPRGPRYFVRSKKFKPQRPNSFLGDYPLMRAAEMYLIEAEALAQSGNIAGALAVLNEYGVTRQPSYDYQGTDKNDVVHEIWKHKRIELWGEGFGFHEAKRRMTPVRGGGVTPDANISYANGGFRQGVERGTVAAGNNLLVFRIPSSEFEQNRACIQNP